MAVALLWHLHQPEYRDPSTGRPCMPWTRLHALRGYRDLLVETLEGEVPWTLNVGAGLLEQLAAYAEGVDDEHLALTRRAVDTLTAAEVETVRATFPCGHPQMRKTVAYERIERRIGAGEPLTPQELLDLQVLSTLVWSGATLRRDEPSVRALLAKGSGFTEGDKHALLEVQDRTLKALPGLFRRVAEAGHATFTTTPLHHPILPLLLDLSVAGRSVRVPPDVELALPEHVRLQLERGKAVAEGMLGVRVEGCWPSEGAVSPELVPFFAEAGFQWFVTDEGILERSRRTGEGEGAWSVGDGVLAFFRDRALSDRIGFDYARLSVSEAMADFEDRSQSDGVKVVALDGENPWEAFADAGKAFRARLIDHLHTDGVTLAEAARRPPVGRVDHLHTGSWIGANLEIWAGSPEDHRAWALLAETVEAVGEHPGATEALLAAEGSDWFWWYGPEFDTPFADVFDATFRNHLKAAWRGAGRVPPDVLDLPLVPTTRGCCPPARPLAPLEGEPGWLGAGTWQLPAGAMARSTPVRVEFGWDAAGAFWLRGPVGEAVVLDGRVVELTDEPICHPCGEIVQLMARGRRVRLLRLDWVV